MINPQDGGQDLVRIMMELNEVDVDMSRDQELRDTSSRPSNPLNQDNLPRIYTQSAPAQDMQQIHTAKTLHCCVTIQH
eukprot:4512279-Amphidinium_carterae.1